MSLFSNIQIDVAELPKSEDLELTAISPKYFRILVFNILITYFAFASVITILNVLADDRDIQNIYWYVISALAVLCFASIFLSFLGFKKRKYAMREKDITYSHGYLVNKTLTLPYNRIQHIEIARSFLARKLGLSTLKIYSAGESGGDIAIKGLPKAIAEKQYAFLTQIINERL